jgi:hypothetical protein
MINMNFVKNLGTNDAEYANSETNCENVNIIPNISCVILLYRIHNLLSPILQHFHLNHQHQ